MTDRQYDASTAQALMNFAYREYESEANAPYIIREGGVYANESFRAISPQGAAFDWIPAEDIDWVAGQNPNIAPFLPVPFTAKELAACMLDGIGGAIQEILDRRIGYPLDDEALDIFAARFSWVRDALKEAYLLAADAQLVVGEFDHDEEARVHLLAKQYDEANGLANSREGVFEQGISPETARERRANAVASVADLESRLMQAQAAVAAKWLAWRKSMVRQLLQSAGSTDLANRKRANCDEWTPEEIAEIYELCKTNSQAKVGQMYGVTPQRIQQLLAKHQKTTADAITPKSSQKSLKLPTPNDPFRLAKK